jgi:hypothetical protein
MIRYALLCEHDHAWDAWFASSDSFDAQAARGLVACPVCNSTQVRKAPMAPAVVRSKSDHPPAPVASAPESLDAPAPVKAFFDRWRQHIAENYDYVGDAFADETRKILDGESEERLIYGEATPEQARALIEEGAPVAPLPAAASPRSTNRLN